MNTNTEIENIVSWIREWFNENGPSASAVIGLSGGKDSSIVACKSAGERPGHGRNDA